MAKIALRDLKGRFIKGTPQINNSTGCFQKGHSGYLKHPNQTSFQVGHIPWSKENLKGKRMSPKTEFKKNSISYNKGKFGIEHPAWKGGRTKLTESIRKSDKYKLWRKAVYKKANYTCQNCHKRNTMFEAHHIKEFIKLIVENNIRTVKQAMVCDSLWNLDNGILLCSKCHSLTKYGRRING